jgi:hypothetical protein
MYFDNSNYISYTFTNENYTTQPNYYGSPPFTKENDIICPISSGSTTENQTDGKASRAAPFYTLGPVACQNCPFYSYLLPYNYPYVEAEETPDPKNYWYFPYYYDPSFYNDEYSAVQKP